jgi:hypothetical protein
MERESNLNGGEELSRKSVARRPRAALLAGLLLVALAPYVFGDAHTFDLVGPRVALTVTRGGKTLPISNVTELLGGDQLWIHPDFPGDESIHYLLVVAFLQGPTNPPPESWFTRAESWTKRTKERGTYVTVPDGAQQALLFLAPETGGDFSTLRGAVRSKPGVFVRAAQDLEQASLDRTRLDKYLAEITATSNTDPGALKKNSTLLAQTLRLKINEDCFTRPVEQQSVCLTQGSDQMVFDDSHDQSLVATLTSGPSTDLVNALNATPMARGVPFSPYVGAVVDAVRLMATLHTATYQYIPALSLPDDDQLQLRLNAAPSFRNPKSVLVVGLPSIGLSPVPVLHPVDPKQVLCLQQKPLVLPVEGAPLMFSTRMGHDFTVRVEGKGVNPTVLPARPDAVLGGFVVDTRPLSTTPSDPRMTATIHGVWGFVPFEGPSFQLRNASEQEWALAGTESSALVAGHPSTVQIEGECAPCVEKIVLLDASGKDLKPVWKPVPPDKVEVELPLQDAKPGPLSLAVTQYGRTKPDLMALHAYSDAVHLEHFKIFAGDAQGVLTGTHLEEVSGLELNGVHFLPVESSRTEKGSSLELAAPGGSGGLKPGAALAAHVTLKDGRTLDVPATIEPPRPKVDLVNKNLQTASGSSVPVRFAKPEALPQDARLSFFLKAEVPPEFSRTEKIEVATIDGSFSTTLSLGDGSLVQQDAASVLAQLDPLKAFGPAAFGPLQFRPVEANGAKGDWQPLATLVRVPALKEVRCPDSTEKQCTLSGTNLFLLDSVASDSQFKNAVTVPAGYVSDSLFVPRPYGTRLYIKLRDDPSTAATVALPVLPETR